MRTQKRRQPLRYTVEHMLALLLLYLFDSLPIAQHIVAVLNMGIAKDMRMAADELIHYLVNNILQIKATCLLSHTRMENNLHQHVAQLLAHTRSIVVVHSLQVFINLFNHVAANRFMRLLLIPWTATGLTQRAHNIDKRLDIYIIKGLLRQEILSVCLHIVKLCFLYAACLFILILAKADNTGNLPSLITISSLWQLALRHRRNVSARQMINVRLAVKLIQLNRTAFLIRQAQIAQEINLIFIRQDVHEHQLKVAGNHLAIHLRNHQRMVACACCFGIILRINNLQARNRINAQLDISQVQKAHRRLNNEANALLLRRSAQQHNGLFGYERTARHSINNIAFLCSLQHALHHTVIHILKRSSLLIQIIAGGELHLLTAQLLYRRMDSSTQNNLGSALEQSHCFQR